MGDLVELVGLLQVAADQERWRRRRGPAPRTALAGCSDVDAHRNLACPSYDRCLDLVAEAGWPGWTCAWCEQHTTAGKRRAARDVALARPGSPPYPVD